MPGADAEHESIRYAGGRVLRRTPLFSSITSTSPRGSDPSKASSAESFAPELERALPQAGFPRQRMKWNMAKNDTVMRIYYKVTKFPHMQVSEQRVADQYYIKKYSNEAQQN